MGLVIVIISDDNHCISQVPAPGSTTSQCGRADVIRRAMNATAEREIIVLSAHGDMIRDCGCRPRVHNWRRSCIYKSGIPERYEPGK